MNKIFFIFLLIVLSSCIKQIKTNSNFNDFVNTRNQKNNLTFLGADNILINIVLPNDFEKYPINFQKNSHQMLLEILPQNMDFTNFNKSITLINIVVDTSIFNMDFYLDSLKKNINKDGSCNIKDSRFEIINKTDNEAIYKIECGKLTKRKIKNKKNNQGEISIFRSYLKDNQFITIIYNFRGKKFNINDNKKIINEQDYNNFYQMTNQTIICDKNNKSEICDIILSSKSNDFRNIKYKIPNGYISNKNLADKYGVDNFILPKDETLEETKKPVIIIKYFDKKEKLRNSYARRLAEIKSNFKNYKTSPFQINNLDLYRTNFISSGIFFSKSKDNKKTPDPYAFLYLETKNKFILIKIVVNDKKEINSNFVNDFINSIRLD